MDDYDLTEELAILATRAANEGVPIAAIGRIIQQPFTVVTNALKTALSVGRIAELPKADWPPAAKWSERLPTVPRSANADDVEFACRKAFKLTPLEASFVMVLLRYDCTTKERLHNVVEQKRQQRSSRPDSNETTAIKIVDVVICKLRKKLKASDPSFVIETNWGRGYYFDPEVKKAIYDKIGGPYAVPGDNS